MSERDRQAFYVNVKMGRFKGPYPDQVDTSALINSPQPTGKFRECYAHHENGVGQTYIATPSGDALYVDSKLVRRGS